MVLVDEMNATGADGRRELEDKVVSCLKKVINVFKSATSALKIDRLDLRLLMRYHAFLSIVLGLSTVLLPHSFLMSDNGGYSHYAHEFTRLYGCMTLAIGWIVWRSQGIKDGRLARALTEAFAVAYGFQSLVMLRAQFTNPAGHTFLHWNIALFFGALATCYGYMRWIKKIKSFALPGEGGED